MAIARAHSYRPCRYGRAWPELFDQLPDDRTKQAVSSSLADGRLEGAENTRADVSDFIDVTLGRISFDEYLARGIAKVESRSE